VKRLVFIVLALLFPLTVRADLLSKYTLPAERMRGAVFAERFESAASVALNEGTVVGTPSYSVVNGATFDSTNLVYYGDHPKYRPTTNFSVMVKFGNSTSGDYRVLAANTNGNSFSTGWGVIWRPTDNTFRFFVGAAGTYAHITHTDFTREHTVVGTYDGVTARIYMDGVQGTGQAYAAPIPYVGNNGLTMASARTDVASPIYNWIGRVGQVKMFNTALTAQEVLDYSNNATFDYRNKASLSLPMTMATHDPGAAKTLDRSGKGRDVALTVAPTKLQARGYNFNGTTQYMTSPVPYSSLVTTTKGTIVVVLIPQGTSPVEVVFYYGRTVFSDPSVYVGVFKTTVGGLDRIWARVYPAAVLGMPYSNGELIHIVLVWDFVTGWSRLYKNGVLQDSNVNFAPTTLTGVPLIGRKNYYWQGDIKAFSTYPIALTSLQIADDYLNTLKAINEN